jgi:hypothetical protein
MVKQPFSTDLMLSQVLGGARSNAILQLTIPRDHAYDFERAGMICTYLP